MTPINVRLWKRIQCYINKDQQQEFDGLCKEMPSQVVNVILLSSIKHIALTEDEQCLLDSMPLDDINALEFALLRKRDHISMSLLHLLKQHSTPAQYKKFLNHHPLPRKERSSPTTLALHLATHWGFHHISQLLSLNHPSLIIRPSSFLLLKAEKQLSRLSMIDPHPLLFTPSYSSSSSNSSSTTASSFCWTPPASPIPTKEPVSQHPVTQHTKKKVRFDPQSVLLDMCMSGDEDIITHLKSLDMDLNLVRDVRQRSLLHIVCMQGHEHLLECLLKHNINVNLPDQDGIYIYIHISKWGTLNK